MQRERDEMRFGGNTQTLKSTTKTLTFFDYHNLVLRTRKKVITTYIYKKFREKKTELVITKLTLHEQTKQQNHAGSLWCETRLCNHTFVILNKHDPHKNAKMQNDLRKQKKRQASSPAHPNTQA